MRLLGAVGSRHVNRALVAVDRYMQLPRVAADFAVLNERASDVGLEVNLHLFTAVRAGEVELRIHGKDSTPRALYQYPIIRPALTAVSQQTSETPPITASC